jgi:thioredoxin reductase
MQADTLFDVLIIGGSHAGLAAALTLGRALRQVLVLDSGAPCNRVSPRAHNFPTHDGRPSDEIRALARLELAQYATVRLQDGFVAAASQEDFGFSVTTQDGAAYRAKKLILATGIRDVMPALPGFAECWGRTILHCPYCHGYEVRGKATAVRGNGDGGFELARLISNWTDDLRLLTDGPSTLTAEQAADLARHDIAVIQDPLQAIHHADGQLSAIVFQGGQSIRVDALYAHLPFTHSSNITLQLGCGFTPEGHVQVDDWQRTTVPGVYACGDCTTMLRTVAHAVMTGTKAAAILNRELIVEAF